MLASAGFERVAGVGGAVAVVVLAVGLARGLPRAVAWAVAGLGAEYGAWFAVRGGPLDTRSPLYAAGLVAIAELAYWALDRRALSEPDAELELRRTARLFVVVFAAIAGGALLLGAASVSVGGGVGLEAVGVAGAVALLAVLARLARAVHESDA